jgi:serine/threonine protein kinase
LLLALDHCHGYQHVINRDIKPENIFMFETACGSFILKIGDFGLGRHSSLPSRSNFTPTVQTQPYKAPEVLFGMPYHSEADIWSAGIVIGDMLKECGKYFLNPLGIGDASLINEWRTLVTFLFFIIV